MKLTYLTAPIQAAYSQAMAAAKRAQRVVRPASSVQAPSTEAILQRDPSKDEEWQAREIPRRAQYQGKSWEEIVGVRSFTPIEISHVQAVRLRPKNTLGQSELRGVSSERHWLAQQAWLKDGTRFSAEAIEKLKLLGQLAFVENAIAQSTTSEEFIRLMREAGLEEVVFAEVKHGD